MKLSNRDKVKLTASFAGEGGTEATAADVPEWSNSNDSVATLEVEEDGMSSMLTTVDDAEGTTTVTVKSKVDTEKEGRHSVEAELEIEVKGEEVATGSIKASDIEPKELETETARQERRLAASREEQGLTTGKTAPTKRKTSQMTDEEINKKESARLRPSTRPAG